MNADKSGSPMTVTLPNRLTLRVTAKSGSLATNDATELLHTVFYL